MSAAVKGLSSSYSYSQRHAALVRCSSTAVRLNPPNIPPPPPPAIISGSSLQLVPTTTECFVSPPSGRFSSQHKEQTVMFECDLYSAVSFNQSSSLRRRQGAIGVRVCENDSQPSLYFRGGFAPKQALHYKRPLCSFLFLPVTLLSQQQRKEREMVRQQEKGPHRRLDDMRREEDRRLAEREQVTNHGRRGAAVSQSMPSVGVPTGDTVQVALGGEIPRVGCHSSKGLN